MHFFTLPLADEGSAVPIVPVAVFERLLELRRRRQRFPSPDPPRMDWIVVSSLFPQSVSLSGVLG